ncbi:MAG TPA: hypothetical protein DCK95_03385 [Anaerolineaceae bacterium]|nr:hypothetical protein [Anaerolineaceae bacterium]
MTKNVPSYMKKAFERTAHPYYYYESLFSTPEALQEVLSERSISTIKEAAQLLKDKKAIYFVGNGTSYYDAVAGPYAMNYFTDINSWSRPSYDFYNYPPSQLGKDCAVVGISHSGSTFETVKALKMMQAAGVTTIAITDKDDSEVFNYADAVLYNDVMENQGPKTKSFVASILRTHLLALFVAEANGKDISKDMSAYQKAPEIARQVLQENEAVIKDFAQKRKDINLTRFAVAGTGFQYADACEGALKMTEAALVHSVCWELEECIHGHWYSIQPHELVMVLAIEGSTLEKSKDLIKGLKVINADFWVITNSADDFPEAGFVTRIPEGLPEYVYPLFTILPLYTFTYYLTLAIGKSHLDHGPYDTQEFMDARLVFRESETYK